MALESGAVITPNKKNVILDALNEELKNLNDKIKNQQLDDLVKGSLSGSRMTLQNLLNSFMERKGVITPDETTAAVKAIEEAKRKRLQENYVLGMKKGVIWLLALIAIGGGIYWYTQKKGG